MQDNTVPPNIRLWQLVIGFANTNVIHTLVKSGITEHLRDNPKSLEELAEAGCFNRDVLYRVLRYAAAIGIVEVNNGCYLLTETGRFMLKGALGSLYGGIMLMGAEPWLVSWNNLASSLKNGESAFSQTMGAPFFEYLQTHPDHAKMFDEWMTANSTMAAGVIPDTFDFSPFQTVCDIAGGHGLLLKSILAANPKVHGILYDMDNVVKDHILQDFTGRAVVEAGNFFERIPEADLFIMKHIIHDWNDEKASKILAVCRKAMKPDSRLLIIERVIESETDINALFMDLHMQVMGGGKERTANEYEILVEKCGLKLNRIIPTKSPLKLLEVTL